jgi:hypothetical protein
MIRWARRATLRRQGPGVTLHDFFLYAAVAGGALFLVQLVLSMMGAGDADLDIGGDHHPSADTAFKVLSLQGLTAFFAMFGLVGLALYHESQAGAAVSVLGGLTGGVLTTWLISVIFSAAKGLEVSGTVDLQKAIGLTGTVYLGITSDKPGKLTININGRLLTLDAVTSGEPLKTGDEARVTRVLGDGSVGVERAQSERLLQ